jgi:hypothetical protein
MGRAGSQYLDEESYERDLPRPSARQIPSLSHYFLHHARSNPLPAKGSISIKTLTH